MTTARIKDPIFFEISWSRLISFVDEAAAALELAVRITRQIAERAPQRAPHDPLSEK